MSSIEKISVIGAGAMGAFYASKFFDMDNNCISLVAKGERYERLKGKGLIVNNRHYSLPVMRPEDNTPPSDLIIVAVKHHHLREAIQDIKNRIGENSLLISVMNGIDSEEQIAAVYGMDRVLYAVAVGIDAVRQGNVITCTTQGKLFFGEARNPVLTQRVKLVQSLFERAGISSETPEDMIRILWWKFMINVGINQVSAVLRAPYGVFQRSQEARDLMESAMREVMTIARAAGVDLSEQDIDNWYSFLSGLSPQGKTSMLQDVEARSKTEVEMFAGKVIELGKTYGIPTPVNQTLFRLLKVIEQNFDEI
ncbi:MAG: ketopantoate reductase family protein [Deltaproteobacteria bacterium]|nr:ketopantoate reductase family protein [Deltaproteobacteria bacterium]MBW2308333.1 ketopantoate reductase family protein [Deltaproteobacteria bacterium]